MRRSRTTHETGSRQDPGRALIGDGQDAQRPRGGSAPGAATTASTASHTAAPQLADDDREGEDAQREMHQGIADRAPGGSVRELAAPSLDGPGSARRSRARETAASGAVRGSPSGGTARRRPGRPGPRAGRPGSRPTDRLRPTTQTTKPMMATTRSVSGITGAARRAARGRTGRERPLPRRRPFLRCSSSSPPSCGQLQPVLSCFRRDER